MLHEEDGHIRKKVALIVRCLNDGVEYRRDFDKQQKCPKCGFEKYDTVNEIYEGEDINQGGDHGAK